MYEITINTILSLEYIALSKTVKVSDIRVTFFRFLPLSRLSSSPFSQSNIIKQQ